MFFAAGVYILYTISLFALDTVTLEQAIMNIFGEEAY
jgi:hypothetical protein